MKKVIINADDFGLHPSVNAAVMEAYRNGCLRSTSFMSVGAAAEEAAELARQERELGTGLHLTLVAERPVSPVDRVRSLVDENGLFWSDYRVFISRWLRGLIRVEEVALECEAQICRMEQLGLKISHLDSHQHLHVLPGIIDICLAVMRSHGIRCMRRPAEGLFFRGSVPFSSFRFLSRGGLSLLAGWAGHRAAAQYVVMPNHFYGMIAGGQMNGKRLRKILVNLPEGTSEVMLHPGTDRQALGKKYNWGYGWEPELQAMTDDETLKLMKFLKINTISYRELQSVGSK